ncbi:MAG: hypothetical protein ACK4G2_02225 [Novosphingobium sp.]
MQTQETSRAPSPFEGATFRRAFARWGDAQQAGERAAWALFETPAPDLAALELKLEIAFDPELNLFARRTADDADRVRAAIMADVARLAGA